MWQLREQNGMAKWYKGNEQFVILGTWQALDYLGEA